jgi:hypothetical protein
MRATGATRQEILDPYGIVTLTAHKREKAILSILAVHEFRWLQERHVETPRAVRAMVARWFRSVG